MKSANLPKLSVVKSTVSIDASAVKGQNRDEFLFHVGTIGQAQAKVKAIQKLVKQARRAAMDAGYVLGDLDEAVKMQDMEPEDVKATIVRKAQYANWLGTAPEIKQGDLFATADETDEYDVWFQEGRDDGLTGQPAKGDRYDGTSEPGQARLKGWNEGNDKREALKAIQLEAFKAAEKAETEKKKAKAKKAETKESVDA